MSPSPPNIHEAVLPRERIRRARREKKDPSQFCPLCGLELHPDHCKLRCPQCGYYMSCSDFY